MQRSDPHGTFENHPPDVNADGPGHGFVRHSATLPIVWAEVGHGRKERVVTRCDGSDGGAKGAADHAGEQPVCAKKAGVVKIAPKEPPAAKAGIPCAEEGAMRGKTGNLQKRCYTNAHDAARAGHCRGDIGGATAGGADDGDGNAAICAGMATAGPRIQSFQSS